MKEVLLQASRLILPLAGISQTAHKSVTLVLGITERQAATRFNAWRTAKANLSPSFRNAARLHAGYTFSKTERM